MRLIDADELPIKYDGHTVGVWKNDIDNAPTVEAIPIEWIKNYMKNEALSKGQSIKYDITAWEILAEWFGLNDYEEFEKWWEKENEINRCR